VAGITTRTRIRFFQQQPKRNKKKSVEFLFRIESDAEGNSHGVRQAIGTTPQYLFRYLETKPASGFRIEYSALRVKSRLLTTPELLLSTSLG
jgi:hypothetical protein